MQAHHNTNTRDNYLLHFFLAGTSCKCMPSCIPLYCWHILSSPHLHGDSIYLLKWLLLAGCFFHSEQFLEHNPQCQLRDQHDMTCWISGMSRPQPNAMVANTTLNHVSLQNASMTCSFIPIVDALVYISAKQLPGTAGPSQEYTKASFRKCFRNVYIVPQSSHLGMECDNRITICVYKLHTNHNILMHSSTQSMCVKAYKDAYFLQKTRVLGKVVGSFKFPWGDRTAFAISWTPSITSSR